MKIAFLIPISLASPSGRRYFPLAAELVRQGHDVTVIALHHDLPACPTRTFWRDGVFVQYAGQMSVRKSGNQKYPLTTRQLMTASAGAVLGMLRATLASQLDAIHLGKAQPVNGLAGVLAAWLRPGLRLYVDCDDDELYANRLTRDWQRRIVSWWQDQLPRLADGVTVNTRYQIDRVRQLGVPVDRIVYVPNGVDLRAFALPSSEMIAETRRSLSLPAGPLVVYASTIGLTTHPVDLLLDAFTLLARTDSAKTLVIAGGGEDFSWLKGRVQKSDLAGRVILLGQVPATQVSALLAAADVTVDPVWDDVAARSRSPLKIVESLATGTPVVTGDVGDRRETIGDAGMLVPPGDPAALAFGIRQVLQSGISRADWRARARAQAEQFRWDRLGAEFARIYSVTGRC